MTSAHVSEDTEALGRCLRARDVTGLQAASVGSAVLGRLRHASWRASLDFANIVALTVLIDHSVGRIKWVRAPLRFTLDLRHVSVIVGCETARVGTGLVTSLSARALDIIKLHDIASGASGHRVSLRPRLINIIDDHGIANELRRSRWACLNLGQVVDGVQRVIGLALRLELDNLRGSSTDIVSPQVSFLLVQSNVEGARARSVNIPVRIDVLSFVNFL